MFFFLNARFSEFLTDIHKEIFYSAPYIKINIFHKGAYFYESRHKNPKYLIYFYRPKTLLTFNLSWIILSCFEILFIPFLNLWRISFSWSILPSGGFCCYLQHSGKNLGKLYFTTLNVFLDIFHFKERFTVIHRIVIFLP